MMHSIEKRDPLTEPLAPRVLNGRTGKCVGSRTLFNGEFVRSGTYASMHHDVMEALSVVLNEIRDLRELVEKMSVK
jgi:hypothetical protein